MTPPGSSCSPSPPSLADLRRARARVASLAAMVARHEAEAAKHAPRAALLPGSFAATAVRAFRTLAAIAGRRLDTARAELAALERRRRCGARCRDGHACRAPANGRGGRCKLHGGRSTGPRTAEGRALALAALARVNKARAAPRPPPSAPGDTPR